METSRAKFYVLFSIKTITYVVPHSMCLFSIETSVHIRCATFCVLFSMETRRIFRKLVTNQFSCLEDFGYFGQRFAFRTVFSKTSYSYCCCSCSFEHEYLGYLSDSGCINEQLYEKIVKSIINGQCPHVVKVSVYMNLFDSG